jgi:hypothetical protein
MGVWKITKKWSCIPLVAWKITNKWSCIPWGMVHNKQMNHFLLFSIHPGECSSIYMLLSIHTREYIWICFFFLHPAEYSFICLLFNIHTVEYSFICLLFTIHHGIQLHLIYVLRWRPSWISDRHKKQ